jgi:hypothetical protein
MGKQYEAIPPIDGDFKWENDRKKHMDWSFRTTK